MSGHEPVAPTLDGWLIDAKAAGALLGVPQSWVRQEARADRIPHVRLGRYVRFDPKELEIWWRARARGPRRRRTGVNPADRGCDSA
jgi:excisionase family DNA binding protein